jgi:hypothetical protein
MSRRRHLIPFLYSNSGTKPSGSYDLFLSRASQYYNTPESKVVVAKEGSLLLGDGQASTSAVKQDINNEAVQDPDNTQSNVESQTIDEQKQKQITENVKKARQLASEGPLKVMSLEVSKQEDSDNLTGQGKRKSASSKSVHKKKPKITFTFN